MPRISTCAGRCPNRLLDLNLVADVYLFDTLTHALARVSGARARSPWWEVSTGPSLDAAGRVIAFSSRHPIDPSDVKHDFDLFVEEIPVVREPTSKRGPASTLRASCRSTRCSRWAAAALAVGKG